MATKKGTKMRPFPGGGVLREMYEQRRMSTRAMGRELGIQASTVRLWLAEVGVSMRSISEAKAGQKPAAHTVLASVRARRKHVVDGKPEVGYKKRSEEHTSELQSPDHLVCRLLLEKKNVNTSPTSDNVICSSRSTPRS